MLRLRTAAAIARPDPRPYSLDEDTLQFYRDLLGDRRNELDPGLAARGTNIAFADLAGRALHAAPGPAADPDLLVLAYALHDLHPLTTVSSRLNHELGGGSRSFAISEQGLGAPFTALRIAMSYASSGRCASVAMFVLEQSTYPYPEAFSSDNDLTDSGVYLRFDDSAPGGWEPSGPPTSATTAELGRMLATADGDTLVVAGPWVDPAVLTGLNCHRVQPGSYCTSVWAALATHHRQWTGRYAHLILCDTDVRRGVSRVVRLVSSDVDAAPDVLLAAAR